jgi:hypothetical protein
MKVLYNSLPKNMVDHYILIYTNHGELMKSLGSHGSSSLLFVMKVCELLLSKTSPYFQASDAVDTALA